MDLLASSGSDVPITDAFRYGNYIEGVVWFVVGGLAFKAARDRGARRFAPAFLITFIAFGVSDWVESTTGAWWWPWWLFAWKAICVLAVVAMLYAVKRQAARGSLNAGRSGSNPSG
ncbi:MAG TPA: hypothetical protein VF595_10635 [Tepidisphaeraceae bacterium]